MAKITRKELLKKPDEFITFSSRVIVFAREHSRQFTYLCIIVVGLFLIYIGINTYKKYINKKGQDSYNMAYYTILKNMLQQADLVKFAKADPLPDENDAHLENAFKFVMNTKFQTSELQKQEIESVGNEITS